MKLIERLRKLKRKKVLINPRFQLKFILFSTLVSLFAILVMYLSCYYFFWELRHLGRQLGLPSESVFFQYIETQQSVMNGITVVTSSVLFFGIFLVGLVYSHRIAGPVFRLERHMRGIASGKELTKIKFRTKDYFPELAEALNEMVVRLKK